MDGIASTSTCHQKPIASCTTELAKITNCKTSQTLLLPIFDYDHGPNEALKCWHVNFLVPLPSLQQLWGAIGGLASTLRPPQYVIQSPDPVRQRNWLKALITIHHNHYSGTYWYVVLALMRHGSVGTFLFYSCQDSNSYWVQLVALLPPQHDIHISQLVPQN